MMSCDGGVLEHDNLFMAEATTSRAPWDKRDAPS